MLLWFEEPLISATRYAITAGANDKDSVIGSEEIFQTSEGDNRASGQNFDEIQYLINFSPDGSHQRTWARATDRGVERLAPLNIFDTRNVVVYMTRDTMRWWM